MDYKTKRNLLARSFQDALNIINNDEVLTNSVEQTRTHTEILTDWKDMSVELHDNLENYNISVVNGRTLEVASYYARRGYNVTVLNFASATHPGGKVVDGPSAQEESLCRISTLYPCLNTIECMNKFYKPHRIALKNHMTGTPKWYSDDIIYTPNIMVFRDDTDIPIGKSLHHLQCYDVNVITCAAPNMIQVDTDIYADELDEVLTKRIIHICETAVCVDTDVLILGAFGCGVFNNPPHIVANAFRKVLSDSKYNRFNLVIFAIVNDGKGRDNFEVFSDILTK